MKICPNCKIAYDDKYDFCKKCGSKLQTKEEKKVCPNCGEEITTDGAFCPFCGTTSSEERPSIKTTRLKSYSNDSGQNEKTVIDGTNIVKGESKNGIFVAGIVLLVVLVGFFLFNNLPATNPNILANSEGEIIFANAKKDGKWGTIDSKGNWIIKPQYYYIGDFSEGLAPAVDFNTKKLGFIDVLGKWVIEPKFSITDNELYEMGKDEKLLWDWINYYGFQEGLAPVRIEKNKLGYINKNGKYLFGKYDEAYKFKNDFANVTVHKGETLSDYICAVIDKEGKYVVKPIKSHIWGIADGYFVVFTGYGRGYVKPYENKLCSPVYDAAYSFHEGLAVVVQNGDLCIIDKNFNVIRNLSYVKELRNPRKVNPILKEFKNGKLTLSYDDVNEETIEITFDKGGNIINKQKADFTRKPKYVDGVAVVSEYKAGKVLHGVIDENGKYIIELGSYEAIRQSSCGLIVAKWNGKFGALDSKAKNVIIPNEFDVIDIFKKYKKQDLNL